MSFARCFAAAALGLFCLSAQANLITNGDFQTDATGWSFNRTNPGDAGWRNTGRTGGSFWVNHNGNDVGPSEPDPRLYQSIATVAGSEYVLTFDFARNVIAANAVGLAVDVDGVQLMSFVIPADYGWRTVTLYFTAAGALTTISFRTEIGGTDYDAYIDNVSVVLDGSGTPVTEPGTLALLGLGLAGLGLARRCARH